MYWLRLAGGVIVILYVAVFLLSLKRRGADHFLDRRGKLRLFSTGLGIFLGLVLIFRPFLAPLLVLVWIINGALLSWVDYFQERHRGRR
jgi:hypothetical protein